MFLLLTVFIYPAALVVVILNKRILCDFYSACMIMLCCSAQDTAASMIHNDT